MPAFSLDAIDEYGKAHKGTIDADTERSARILLRAQGLVPLNVQNLQFANKNQKTGFKLLRRRIFNSTALAIWTRQIAGLVTSGLALERALHMLASETTDERQQHLLAALHAQVNSGSSFARALADWPDEFSDVYIAVIDAGEKSGNLGMVLERLADDLENKQALQSQVIGAALYPAIVTIVGLLIVTFLLIYVVPQVAKVFTGSHRSLPLLTEVLMMLSHFLQRYIWWLIIGIVLCVYLLHRWLRIPSQRERFDAAWLQLPILGRLSAQYNAARFCSTLAMLSGSGVPILKALQAAAQTVGNLAMRRDALDALVLVREGAPLAAVLAQKKRFPTLISMFARLGEQTGQLPLMLDRAAQQLQREVSHRAVRLATILEPLLIVAMGIAVMLIVLAVLLPIIQMNQWVR